MARDEGAGAGSVFLAFILGAVSGAAVALLYAPGYRRGFSPGEILALPYLHGALRAARRSHVGDAGAPIIGAPVHLFFEAKQ